MGEIRKRFAIVLSRSDYSEFEAKGVSSLPSRTVEEVSLALAQLKYYVVVLADSPSDNIQSHLDDNNFVWVNESPTYCNITKAFQTLADMAGNHAGYPIPQHELIVYITGHGGYQAKSAFRKIRVTDSTYGVLLGDAGYSNDCLSKLYTLDMLYNDISPIKQRWHKVLVVLDACSSGAAFCMDASEPSVHLRGSTLTAESQRLFRAPSFHCLAAAPRDKKALAVENYGSRLLQAMLEEWWRDGKAFRPDQDQWMSMPVMMEAINNNLQNVLQVFNANKSSPDPKLSRQTALYARLPWNGAQNIGEFFAFNPNFIVNKLAMFPQHTPIFSGRVEQLELMDSILQASNTLLVSGLAGMGKSAIAIEFATRHEDDFKWLLWLNMTNSSTMSISLQRAARHVGLVSDSFAIDVEGVLKEMRHWLEHATNYLVVVDGWNTVETDSNKNGLTAGRLGGKVIITTQIRSAPAFGLEVKYLLELKELEEESAMHYFQNRLGDPENWPLISETVRIIIKKLGYMPLALEIASAYLQERDDLTVDVFLARLDDDTLAALSQVEENDRVLRTFKMSIDRAKEIGGALVDEIARVFGFVEESGVDTELLRMLVIGRRQEKSEELDHLFDKGIAALRKLYLVKWKKPRYIMHNVVEYVCREYAFENKNQRRVFLKKMGNLLLSDIGDDDEELVVKSVTDWARGVRVHGMRLLRWIVKEELKEEWCVRLAVRISLLWQLSAEYAIAMDAIEMGLECLEDDSSLLAAAAIHTKGTLLYDLCEYDHALVEAKRALDIQIRGLRSEDVQSAHIFHLLGRIQRTKANYEDSLTFYARSLSIKLSKLGPKHSSTASTWQCIAVNFKSQKEYAKALSAYECALEILETSLGPRHPSTGTVILNMGDIYRELKELDKAWRYFNDAKNIFETHFGTTHPHFGATLINMGLLCADNSKYSDAKELYEQALSAFPYDCPARSNTLFNLGELFEKTGENRQALDYYNRGLVICKKIFGDGHEDTIETQDCVDRMERTIEHDEGQQADAETED